MPPFEAFPGQVSRTLTCFQKQEPWPSPVDLGLHWGTCCGAHAPSRGRLGSGCSVGYRTAPPTGRSGLGSRPLMGKGVSSPYHTCFFPKRLWLERRSFYSGACQLGADEVVISNPNRIFKQTRCCFGTSCVLKIFTQA